MVENKGEENYEANNSITFSISMEEHEAIIIVTNYMHIFPLNEKKKYWKLKVEKFAYDSNQTIMRAESFSIQ